MWAFSALGGAGLSARSAAQAGLLKATQMRTFLADQLQAAGPADGVDPERAAAGLLALVDGLGLQLLSRQYAEQDAVAALDAPLALLFGTQTGLEPAHRSPGQKGRIST